MSPSAAVRMQADRLKNKALKHQFLIVEVATIGDRRYPHTLFGCETIEEALKLCKQMNSDAGFQKFAVRGNVAKTDSADE